MKFTGTTYRPPFEAQSLLLQVTTGCSHNRCSFCTMYQDVDFSIESLHQIESDLQEVSIYKDRITRVFLENGDPFVLSAHQLLKICDLIHNYLPYVDTIAMYATILNIQTKTDEELIKLRQAGINELNIGIETGYDKGLELLHKGYDSQTLLSQLQRLDHAHIDYGLNIIYGSAGRTYHKESILKTIELINKTHPYLIFTGTIHADKGCPLYEDIKNHLFIENTFEDYLEEEELFIKYLDVECFYFGLHPSNVTRMQGYIPQDRELLLQQIYNNKEALKKHLHSVPKRIQEGAIIIQK